MSLEQMRDDFERALSEFAKLPAARFQSYRSDDQHYGNAPGDGVARGELDLAWWAWQASRAAVVVVLPPALEDDLTLVAAIEAAGVKVAP